MFTEPPEQSAREEIEKIRSKQIGNLARVLREDCTALLALVLILIRKGVVTDAELEEAKLEAAAQV